MNLVTTWLLRRVLELGGLLGVALAAWDKLPPETHATVLLLLNNNWQNITLGALVPLAISLWGYGWSFISTIRPQVVTSDGKQLPLPKHSTEALKVEVIAKSAQKGKTIVEALKGILGK